jgi:peptidoglycan/xylan/chitin deacetylase (PgdA/CDA1 family)
MNVTRREFMKAGAAAAALCLAGPAGALASGPGIPVLLYHDISDQFDDVYTVSPSVFSAQMEWLYWQGYRAVSLREAARPGGDTGKAVVITFDDGYASFMDYAFPALEEYGFKCTINIIGGYAGGHLDRNGARPVLSWDEYRFLDESGTAEFGCHTYGLHVRDGLAARSKEALREDLGRFNEEFRRRMGRSTDILAWPFGVYDSRSVEVAREAGFRYFLTSEEGRFEAGALDRIPRINISNRLDMISFQQYIEGI